MRRRAILVVLLLMVGALLIAVPTLLASDANKPGARTVQGGTSSVAGVSTRGIGVLRLGDHFGNVGAYKGANYVVVSRADAARAAKLKATSFVYMSGVDMPETGWNSGVALSVAAARGWLLKSSSGDVLHAESYSHQIGDVGNPDYQRAWLTNVAAFAKRTGVDGVFIDSVLSDISPFISGRTYPAKYPTQQAWADAMLSFIRYVGPGLKAKGLQVIVNADGYTPDTPKYNDGSLTIAWWRQLAPYVTGLLQEFWMQNPGDLAKMRVNGGSWDEQWNGWQRLVSVAQAGGKDFFGLTRGAADDFRAMRFGRGSFLLDWNGRGGAFIYNPTDDSDPRMGDWAMSLGAPVSKKVEVASGVWRRRYQGGIVVVNANSGPVNVRVAGSVKTIDSADAVIVAT